MCKFCEDYEELTVFTLDKKAGTTIQYSYGKKISVSGFVHDDNDIPLGVASAYIINYCPFCGKELKEDEGSEEN